MSSFRSVNFPNVNFDVIGEIAVEAYTSMHKDLTDDADCQFSVTSMKDIVWGGDMMVEIVLQSTLTPSHHQTLLAHFPHGRPNATSRAAVGMAMLAQRAGVHVPRLCALAEEFHKKIGAEYILYVKEDGTSLDVAWPELSDEQRKAVMKRLAEDLLKLFNHRLASITTTVVPPNYSEDPDEPEPAYLLSRPFDAVPLLDRWPQPALKTTQDYLEALADRILWLFSEGKVNNPWSLGWPGKVSLSYEEKTAIRETWMRLRQLIPYYTGGKFIPRRFKGGAYELAVSLLSDQRGFGIVHTDLKMGRILVNFKDGVLQPLVITGWEHAHTAPLWSCARMPRWLLPDNWRLEPTPILEEDRVKMFHAFYNSIRDIKGPKPGAHWVIAFALGQQERFFEGLIGSHWMFRDTVDVGIKMLKESWELAIPDEEFPIPVDEEWRADPQPSGHRKFLQAPEEKHQEVMDTDIGATEFEVVVTSSEQPATASVIEELNAFLEPLLESAPLLEPTATFDIEIPSTDRLATGLGGGALSKAKRCFVWERVRI
ncbi:unnamed protein product [Somion occarium]|uniref:Aminoglycoside phosphotransferase domain-containing protein n=1 Tax=Somion occarium TaxID=3059160 RepID=A0ABP1CZX3_9APHY